ncbi:hypothetical protein BFF94_017515 [Burkholderia catarinensis]|nr:hypothetical protein BFF94_017515 [Burkholderia catarinensis]
MALHDLLRLVGAAARHVGTVALVAVQADWGVTAFVKQASHRIGGTTMQSRRTATPGSSGRPTCWFFLMWSMDSRTLD